MNALLDAHLSAIRGVYVLAQRVSTAVESEDEFGCKTELKAPWGVLRILHGT